jgi:hypothetical protein
MKRLLDTDTSLGRKHGVDTPEQVCLLDRPAARAWHRGLVLSLRGLRFAARPALLEHRWPQQTAVRIMRQARPTLDPSTPESSRSIRKCCSTRKNSENRPPWRRRRRHCCAGVPGHCERRPIGEERSGSAAPCVQVCRGEEDLMRFRRERAPVGTSMTVLELTAPAHLLAYCLSQPNPEPAAGLAADQECRACRHDHIEPEISYNAMPHYRLRR